MNAGLALTLVPPLPSPAVHPTAPPPSTYSRRMNRERIDRLILRSLGERRMCRTVRPSGKASAWDDLEALVAQASTAVWEVCPFESALGEELASYCAFLARELEINEQMDLPSDKDMARLQALAPRAVEALDAITAPLFQGNADASTRLLARVFGALREELVSRGGAALWPIAA